MFFSDYLKYLKDLKDCLKVKLDGEWQLLRERIAIVCGR